MRRSFKEALLTDPSRGVLLVDRVESLTAASDMSASEVGMQFVSVYQQLKSVPKKSFR